MMRACAMVLEDVCAWSRIGHACCFWAFERHGITDRRDGHDRKVQRRKIDVRVRLAINADARIVALEDPSGVVHVRDIVRPDAVPLGAKPRV